MSPRGVRHTQMIGFARSASAIRRDLKTLADSGQIRRVRGGIESVGSVPANVSARQAGAKTFATAEESAIARKAAKLVKDGESIIITAGSTTQAMVEFLGERQQLDVLTNSISIAPRLLESTSSNRVVLAGGILLREQGLLLSPYENDCVDHFSAQKMFIGCHGMKRAGLMEPDPLVVQANRRLLSRADELIVLADARKLRQRSSMVVAPIDRISTLITDAAAEEAEIEAFRKAGIKVIVATTA